MKNLIFVVFLFFFASTSSVELNNQPIIGILSIEINSHHGSLFPFPSHTSSIPASYVKAVESAGARVVPVLINKPKSYYEDIVNSVNGLLLPGGGAKIGRGNPYYESVRTVYYLAKERNDNGTIFPILGIGLGYEFMITVANDDYNSILQNCSIFYENYPINFTKNPSTTSFFSRLTSEQRDTLENNRSTVNWHIWCARDSNFRSSWIDYDWVITSTSTNSKGLDFVASVEHKKYPFYGVQFHPEKVAYEWKTPRLPRGQKILQANRYFFDQLVFIAKSNTQKFSNKEEKDALIYNYNPHYDKHPSGISGTPYMQFYLFRDN